VPVKSPDLPGSAPDQSAVVLLLVDVIDDLQFEGGAALLTLTPASSPRRSTRC
jgi:hypothetical protein